VRSKAKIPRSHHRVVTRLVKTAPAARRETKARQPCDAEASHRRWISERASRACPNGSQGDGAPRSVAGAEQKQTALAEPTAAACWNEGDEVGFHQPVMTALREVSKPSARSIDP